MFLKKIKEETLDNFILPAYIQTFYKAIFLNYDNNGNAKNYLSDIKKYNLSDEDIINIYKNRREMKKHPIVKNNVIINEMCKSYGINAFFYGMKTLKAMMNDELFDFEIKRYLKNQINFYEKLMYLTSSYINVYPNKENLVVLDINKHNNFFTDGEVLSDEEDTKGRKLTISKPSFIIKTNKDDIYRNRDIIKIYGYDLDSNLLPSYKDINRGKTYIK